MYKLQPEKYKIVIPLLESNNELSVFSVIDGIVPGEIFVNDLTHPTTTLIQTSECNLLAGKEDDVEFNSFIPDELDFWDPVTPDTDRWNSVIPDIHKNKFVRKYQRRRYTLYKEDYLSFDYCLPEGYCIEPVIPDNLRCSEYENAHRLISWIENWGSDEAFKLYGAGCYIRKDTVIVSWSLSDCSLSDKIAIGVHTDERYRKKGFGLIAVAETIKVCFSNGYKSIDWLCVDTNKGSIAIAEKLGFTLVCKYDSFTPYPPIENLTDLSETEWNEWGAYFENAIMKEPQLLTQCLFAYINANNINKANVILSIHRERKPLEQDINRFIKYLHTIDMATNFQENWMDRV